MLPEIDALMADEFKPGGPGAAIAIVKDDQVIHRQGYGLANVEWNIPIGPDTVFRLASISKQFTAVAIMMLEEQGKLSVDDPITRFFPDYPTSGHDIYVHHLLTHTSGIQSYTDTPEFPTELMRKDMTTEEMLAYFSRRPFNFKPGAKYLYNNSAYFLLGMIIEKVSGMSYADFIRTHIFEPLGMKQSYYMDNEPIIPKRASGYDAVPDNGIQNAGFLSMKLPYAAGSLGSTADDLVLWDKALRANTLVSAATLARMHTPTTLNDGSTHPYGFGWAIGDYRDHHIIHHSGGINGFSTNMIHLFDDGVAVIVLSNLSSFNTGKVMMACVRRALGLPDIERTPVEVSDAVLDKAAGTYLLYEMMPVPITRTEDGKLTLNIGRIIPLVPSSATTFFAQDDPEFELIFENEQDGRYTSVQVDSPLNKLTLTRQPEAAQPPSS